MGESPTWLIQWSRTEVGRRGIVSMKEREEFQTGDHHPGRYATVSNACGESEELLWAHGEEGKLSMKRKGGLLLTLD